MKKLELNISLDNLKNYMDFTDVSSLLSNKSGDPIILELSNSELCAKTNNPDKSFVRFTKIPTSLLLTEQVDIAGGKLLIPLISMSRFKNALVVAALSAVDGNIKINVGYSLDNLKFGGQSADFNVAKVINLKAGKMSHKITCADMTMGKINYLPDTTWAKISVIPEPIYNFELEPTDVAKLSKIMSLDNSETFRITASETGILFQSLESGTKLGFDGNCKLPTSLHDRIISKKNFLSLVSMADNQISSVKFDGARFVTHQNDTVIINASIEVRV